MHVTEGKSFIFKLLLGVCVGSLIFFAFLESSLCISAYVYKKQILAEAYSKSQNDSDYKILCLGESTTKGFGNNSWPNFLEQRLNKSKNNRKFKLINLGAPGVSSSFFSEKIDDFLNLYRPNLVITMLGVNDDSNLLVENKPPENYTYLDSLRSVQLIRRLLKSLRARYSSVDKVISNPEIDSLLMQEPTIEVPPPELNHLNLPALKYYPELDQLKTPLEILNFLKVKLKEDPKNLSIMYRLIVVHEMLANFDEQIDLLLQLAEIDEPKGAADCAVRAAKLILDLGGDSNKIINACLRALELDPDNIEAMTVLADIETSKGKLEKIELMLLRAQKKYPYRYEVALALERVSSLIGRPREKLFQDTEAIMKNGLVTEPGNYQIYRNLIGYYLVKDKREFAESIYKKAVEVFPNSYEFITGMGDNYFFLKRYREAIEVYKKVVKFKRHREELKKQKSIEQFAISIMLNTKSGLIDDFLKNTGLFKPILNLNTQRNYNLIAKTISDKGIAHIAMQYPLTPTWQLTKILEQWPAVIVVGNEDNFKQALADHLYEQLFTDSFANTFGHMTEYGHDLIAERLEHVIRQKVINH